MRAKRSKKYRKVMQQYELAFGFREPYQVLVDSHFLRAVHSFRMDLIPSLERTLQGKAKPFITKCSLAAITNSKPPQQSASKDHPKKNDGNIHPSRAAYHSRPAYLPPPTVLPLRHCNHKRQKHASGEIGDGGDGDSDGDGDGREHGHEEEDVTLDEEDCIMSLICPNEELKRNKEHYILASADPIVTSAQKRELEEQQKNPRRRKNHSRDAETAIPRNDIRRKARQVPGVPIIYVKRSVMVLEPLSGESEQIREGFERGKFRSGLVSKEPVATGKRKRDDGEQKQGRSSLPRGSKVKKAKGPNPLSMKNPKKREGQRLQQKKGEKGGDNGGGGGGGGEKD